MVSVIWESKSTDEQNEREITGCGEIVLFQRERESRNVGMRERKGWRGNQYV